MATAVQDRLGLDIEGLALLLDIDVPDEGSALEAKLTLWLSAAKQAADLYLNNAFYVIDADTHLPVCPYEDGPIPDLVKMGVVEWVETRLYEKPKGVSEEKTSKLQVKYTAFATVQDAQLAVKATYWDGFRIPPV